MVHDQAHKRNIYAVMDPNHLEQMIASGRDYLLQFDSSKGATQLNQYALMQVPIDDQVQPEHWFQVPILNKFARLGRHRAVTYTFRGRRLATLDRIQYKAAIDESGRTVLAPIAIVRPVRVVPSLRFETVHQIRPELQEEYVVRFRSFVPSVFRDMPDPQMVSDPAKQISNTLLFELPRPEGHPLRILEANPMEYNARLRLFSTASEPPILDSEVERTIQEPREKGPLARRPINPQDEPSWSAKGKRTKAGSSRS